MTTDYERLVKRGREIARQRDREKPEYKRLASLVSLSRGQFLSQERVTCEACGMVDEARHMVWKQDSDDIPLYDREWRLTLWHAGRQRAEFRVFYYCQNCHGALVDG